MLTIITPDKKSVHRGTYCYNIDSESIEVWSGHTQEYYNLDEVISIHEIVPNQKQNINGVIYANPNLLGG